MCIFCGSQANDWCLKIGGGTEPLDDCKGTTWKSVTDEYKSWATNSSAPGINTLMHETKDQTVNAFKEYYADLKNSSVGYKADNVPNIIGLPWYQNQFAPTDKREDTDTILPKRNPINITDGGLAKVGDPKGPQLGDYSSLDHASTSSSSSSSSPSSSTGSGGAKDPSNSSQASSNGSAKQSPAARLQPTVVTTFAFLLLATLLSPLAASL